MMAILPMYVIEEIIYYHVSGTSEARTPAQNGTFSLAELLQCLGVPLILVYISTSSNQNHNALTFNIPHRGSLHSVV